MFELLQHALGLCSDSSMHPNIIMLLSGGIGFGTLWKYFKFKFISKHEHSHDCNCEHKKEN